MTDTKALVVRVREALVDPEISAKIPDWHPDGALAALSELEARLEALRLMQDDKLIARVAELEEALREIEKYGDRAAVQIARAVFGEVGA